MIDENKAVISETQEHGFNIERLSTKMNRLSVIAIAEGGATSQATFMMDIIDPNSRPYVKIFTLEVIALLLLFAFIYWRCTQKKPKKTAP